MIRFLLGWLLVGQVLAQPVATPRPARPVAARPVVARPVAARPSPANQRTKHEMTQVAKEFLATLSAEQRKQAVFALDDTEQFTWYYTPHDRKGLPLKQMNADQRKAAMALLKTGLSAQGLEKAASIMDMENVLRVIEKKLIRPVP